MAGRATSPYAPADRTGLHLRTGGGIGAAERDCAEAVLAAVLARHARAVDCAYARLSATSGPGGSALAQVNLRVHGAPARIQVPAATPVAAIAAAATRLDRQVRRLTTAWEPWPWPDPERHALHLPGTHTISRLKSFRLHVGMPCQAAAILNAMDYDVYLYTDAETGEDAVVYRSGPTGLALARQHTMRPPALPVTLPLTVNPRRTPELTPGDAAERLCAGWLPYLFYTDPDTRRGNLLYRRYDGDLGLITPILPDPA